MIGAGVARGTGWQHLGAYVNLGSYYLVGIPVSLLLGLVLNFKGEGLWSGLVIGATVQSMLLMFITFRTDWEKQVISFIVLNVSMVLILPLCKDIFDIALVVFATINSNVVFS